MHVDHLIFAIGPDGLKADAERLAAELGANYKDGGFHPRFGTRNHIIPLADARYIEVVEVLDHPAAEKAPFGQAVRARSEMGGGWLGWVVSVDDLSPYEARLERSSVPGSRHFPDGRKLEWKQIGIKGLMADPQLPYFLEWVSDESLRPSALPAEVKLEEIEISGSADRLSDWLNVPVGDELDGVRLNLVAPNGHPGINRVTFNSPTRGRVSI
ncbi:VOC family protein [Tessaracoccus sp. OS52]|uniref:VOC family protein n=1 Tax=Tessaracoccus sp. OS52 TaxID=2886691 RepID=UPI001D103C7E|nr:VOC family protein [Tessaracoccus sp. OS52]MCC2594656.1 VOC family protein [Tessaracoccus sp. OS52]